MLLDRAGAVGGEQARKVLDAFQQRFADVRVHGTRGKRAIYRRNEAKRNGAWYAREARDLPP